ncbi:MAG: lytic murein transglycosylase [Actinomycetota bacterium]|nr:lytic murein transglycosylase [Actinomycetota bacterium]
MSSRKLLIVLALTGSLLLALAGLAAPVASADTCTISITVLGGQTYTFTVSNVAPGTPVSSLKLPPVAGVVTSKTENCVPDSNSSSSTTTTTTTTTSGTPSGSGSSSSSSGSSSASSSSTSSLTSTSSSSSTQPSPAPSRPARRQKPSSHPQRTTSPTQPAGHGKAKAKKKAKAKAKKKVDLPTGKGVPSPSNPSFSLSLPGPAPIGVPNFFIDSFRIPPFLIPIYQAAGIEYQIPWQVLAAINEIETDYGRNLAVSSAGAVGWMQFLPSTFKTWAVDANGDGVADPYNPVDAIFTAARYLHAAGASQNLGRAIFAYNHAIWYVQSVLLRAKLIGGIPSQLIGALTGLVQGHFPVAAPAKYADNQILALAHHRARTANAAVAIDSTASTGTSIYARQGSPAIAVNDGKIVHVGHNVKLGRYVQLQDATGNIYTYSQLGTVSHTYPVPKPVKITPADIARELATPAGKAPKVAPAPAGTASTPASPTSAASAGSQVPKISAASAGIQTTKAAAAPRHHAGGAVRSATTGRISLPVTPATPATSVTAPMAKERLFANPSRAASYAAGGVTQIRNSAQQITNFQNYFSDTLHLGRNQYTLKTLRKGSIVVAGTILGRIAGASHGIASHLYFQIQPAGKNAPAIDPKPILDGWKLLEATAVYRAAGLDPFAGPGAKNPTVGQVLLMSKTQLTERVLQDPKVKIYNCGRRDIATGVIDRRVLATIEFLSASGLEPGVTGLKCGHSISGSTGTDAAGETGSSLDISRINNIPVLGHQGSGSITDFAIRRLLTLQGSVRPDQIISTIGYKGQPNTLALPDHQNRIQITFTPAFGSNQKLSQQVRSLLQPGQWLQLINRISQIPEPVVPIAPSRYALRAGHH